MLTTGRGVVVVYCSRLGGPLPTHVKVLIASVANAIAQLKHYEFGGCHNPKHCYSSNVYFVPDDTLMRDEALELGIRDPSEFFGGVVPYPFVKTKAITHELFDKYAERPEGWSLTFAEKVRSIVLPGYTVFSVGDARTAAKHMLTFGMIRIKEPLAASGKGQAVIATVDGLDALLERIPPRDFAAYGLVLEANLRQVMTLNIGQITVDGTTLTYFGRQRHATNNEGLSEYGGSDLVCVRGGWDVLEEYPMAANIHVGITQARMYDHAMSEYPGFMASRRNYDVGQGIDDAGRWRSGVLESSCRIGGASSAEIAALAAFLRDPAAQLIEASTVTEFGTHLEAPQNAIVHFHGSDPQAGPMIRYTVVTRVMQNVTQTRQSFS